jgi:predicted porin
MKLTSVCQTVLAALPALCSIPAFAQSSVTLYGSVDTGIQYLSNQTTLGSTAGGHHNWKMSIDSACLGQKT